LPTPFGLRQIGRERRKKKRDREEGQIEKESF
jgi:hypothetical protein